MEYRRLGRSGLYVSSLCLGSMQFGWTADEATSFAIMDAFVEAGGCFIDTADIYSNWVDANQGGASEAIIGRWMKERKNRHEVIIATKVRGRMWAGPTGEGLSRAHLMRACDESLKRLQTDYIDLYQTHWYDSNTPLEETLEAMSDLVRAGKVRYIGCSNTPAWRLALALGVSDRYNYARYCSHQPHYNLAKRAEFERELAELCLDQGLGVIPYSPLANGFLTGKYQRGAEIPESARASSVQKRYFNEKGWAVLDALKAVADEVGASNAQVAVAWLLHQPSVTAPIIGANNVEQLQSILPASSLKLSQEQLERLNQASAWED
jgi:Predicted oxidoreductases (related to aryl-alcohol dehydrogenases)